MRKFFIYLILLFFVAGSVHGQFDYDEYKKKADTIRNTIWGWKMAPFEKRIAPDELKQFSQVILARREEITCLATPKMTSIRNVGRTKLSELTYTHTIREMVKINDEVALKEYSERSFLKYAQEFRNKYSTFIGLRLIKPDGSMKEINTDEAIFTRDEENIKTAKLAVPGLQIGDLLDYFVTTIVFYGPDIHFISEEFSFAEEDPILHYSVHVELNNKIAAEYRSLNGAPGFAVTRNANDDIILDASQENLQSVPVNLWLSPYRQIPIIRINMRTGFYSEGFEKANSRTPGTIYKDPPVSNVLKSIRETLDDYEKRARWVVSARREKIGKLAASYLKNNGADSIQNKSIALYYAVRHLFLLQPDKDEVTISGLMSNYQNPPGTWFLSLLKVLLEDFGIETQYIMLPSRFGPLAREAMYSSDLRLALITRDRHLYSGQTILGSPDQLPFDMEGQHGIPFYINATVDNDASLKNGYDLQGSRASKNIHAENLIVRFNPSEPEKLEVDRKTVVTGHARLPLQRDLLLYEDYYETERKMMGISESFIDELNSTRKGKKIIDEYKNAFLEARKEWKENFKEQIEEEWGIKPDPLLDISLLQAGIFNDKPEFIYTTDFIVNAWVKTAGNNYILEVGKMTPAKQKLRPSQRERQVDIYRPYAKTYQYNLSIPLPKNFTVEGLDKLNSKLDNETGSFVTMAKLEADTILISVAQTFKNAFEKAARWPDLLSIIDAATSFENARILLKKM